MVAFQGQFRLSSTLYSGSVLMETLSDKLSYVYSKTSNFPTLTSTRFPQVVTESSLHPEIMFCSVTDSGSVSHRSVSL